MTNTNVLSTNLRSFVKDGIIDFGPILDKSKCSELYNEVLQTRDWSDQIFRSQEDVKTDPQTTKTNPGRGVSNLAEKYDLSFIEENEILNDHLNELVGEDYEILLKKFVVGVPSSWVPDWLKTLTAESLAANLGSYIKSEFRDVTYFRGIDYHMDLIDHPNRTGDYVTLYIYLTDVDTSMSPLHLIEGSHIHGATIFPHNLRNDDQDSIEYGTAGNKFTKLNKKLLVGDCGTIYLWSSMTLHGTQPMEDDKPRISLRYTMEKNPNSKKDTLIDSLLKDLNGDTSMQRTRDDIDPETHQQVKFNKVLR